MERKYIDVNVFVYWLSGEGELLEKAKRWIKTIEKSRKGEYCTSALTIYETVVIVAGLTGKKLNDKDFISDILNAITRIKKLKINPLREKILHDAVKVMIEKGLDFEDAIHYVTAKQCAATRIITNDKDFDKTDLTRSF